MTKKSTTKSRMNIKSRLGHDPLEGLKVESDEDPYVQPRTTDLVEPLELTEPDKQPSEMEPDGGKIILHLPSHFSISEVEEVYGQMSSILETGENSIEVETTEVESIDTAAIQLLYAFTEKTRMSGRDIHWHSRSEKIDEASRLLDIDMFSENK